jgi:thiol:disulfide interchange protein
MKSTLHLLTAVLVTLSCTLTGWSADGPFGMTEESLDQIQVRAAEAKKPILLEFTGSDWCPPCKMMDKQVFSTEAFQKFAGSNLIFVKLDFPQAKPQTDEIKARNEALAKKFNVEGFPTVVLLSPEGKELAREVGYMGGGAEEFISWVKKAQD